MDQVDEQGWMVSDGLSMRKWHCHGEACVSAFCLYISISDSRGVHRIRMHPVVGDLPAVVTVLTHCYSSLQCLSTVLRHKSDAEGCWAD